MHSRTARRILNILTILLFTANFLFGVVPNAAAAGGAYSLKWYAADPAVNHAPYLPTYAKVPPSLKACPTPSGGVGRAADPMKDAVAYGATFSSNDRDALTSLAPATLALGQIVPFEMEIGVSGSTAPENGVIQFTSGFNTHTTSGDDFGYDPNYLVYCAFVDTADTGTIDPGNNAKVDSWTSTLANPGGGASEEIQGTFQISGLDSGDNVIVEIWVVLKSTIPSSASGNVQTRLIDAQTAATPPDAISTGNQTVPLLRVKEFFTSNADVSVTKSDSPDPVVLGSQLTYTITAINNSTDTIANGVVVTDTLDPNTTFVSGSWTAGTGGTCTAAAGVVTCTIGALAQGATVPITIVVTVNSTAPTTNDTSLNAEAGGAGTTCPAGVDLCNKVSETAITADSNTANNSYYQPTNVTANPHLSITKSADLTSYNAVGQTINYTIVATNDGDITLAAVTVTDPSVTGLTCTPANGSSLAPGASLNCTATHTVTQGDLDAGHYANTACVDDGAGGAAQACASKDVPAAPNPHLSITKSASPTSFNAVGQTITYTIVATNDGNITLKGVTVTDPSVTGLSCTPANGSDLAPGASLNCTATHTVTQADLDAGHYANTACVDDGTGGAAQACASKDVPGTQNPHLSITKSADLTSYNAVGQTISYTIVATNDGNVTLHNVTVSDPSVTGLTCIPANGSDLAPGASLNCTATHTVTQADLDAGHYANTACVDDGAGGADKVCASKDVPGITDPHLSITKAATEATYAKVGDVLHYTIVATNDGNVTLHNVTVTDPSVTGLTCTPANGSTLAPGASLNCTATHVVTQGDLDAGHYANTACVDDGAGGAAQACANKDVPGTQNPHLSITKSASPTSFSAVGQTITYTIVATNDGNVTLKGVTVADPSVTGLSCTPANGSDLAPGASLNCTATHAVTQADLDAGHYANTACVDDGAGGADKVCASKDVPGTQNPAITLSKVAVESSYDAVGDVLHYNLVAQNIGNVTLHNVTISDPLLGTLSCTPAQPATLAPTDTITCTGTYTVTQPDLDAGNVHNTATANGKGPQDQPVSATDQAEVPAVQKPHLTITKAVAETTYANVGDTLHYTIVATNDGNVTLHNVTVSDPSVSGLTCIPANGSDVAPGASLNCTATHTVTQADLDAGHYANTACVDDGTGGADKVCASKDVPGTQNPHLLITKSADRSFFDTVGQTITYNIDATNDGNVTLHNVTVTDSLVTGLSCTPANGSDLAPGASLLCTATHVVTQADLDAGHYANTACADDGIGGADKVCASKDVPGDQKPHLSITKVVTEATYAAVGDVLHYTIVATNDGNVTLHNVTVTDPSVSGLSCTPANGSTLAPTASMNCTATHVVTQGDLDAGHYANTACVDDGTGGADKVCASKDVPGTQNPHLAITKAVTETTYAKVGDVLHYTIVATNDGNVTLKGVTVTDPSVSGLTCTPANGSDLAPKASLNCTATHTVTQADLDAGHYANTACVDDGAGGATQACASKDVPGTQNPALSLNKSAVPTVYDHAGQTITYTYVIKNTGNVTLPGPFSVSDDHIGTPASTAFTCGSGPLAPSATTTCTATYNITSADMTVFSVTNKATATTTYKEKTVTSNQAQATVYRQTGALLPTQTTCQMYAAGPSAWPTMYDAFYYQAKVSKGKLTINSVSPGVIFYYNTITAPSASFTFTVQQTNTLGWKPMLIQDTGQAILYTANCTKASGVKVTTTNNPYTVKFTVTGATPGAIYYIGIKYTPANLVGQPVSSPYPTDTYSFLTYVNTVVQPGSGASIQVKPK